MATWDKKFYLPLEDKRRQNQIVGRKGPMGPPLTMLLAGGRGNDSRPHRQTVTAGMAATN